MKNIIIRKTFLTLDFYVLKLILNIRRPMKVLNYPPAVNISFFYFSPLTIAHLPFTIHH